MSRTATAVRASRAGARRKQSAAAKRGGFPRWVLWLAIPVALVVALAVATGSDEKTLGASGEYPYQVGDPGPGEAAPDMVLATVNGDRFDLAEHQGEKVLMYFQEGLMCQPCWDQIRDIERDKAQFEALGIDTIVTITHDPLGPLAQKAQDEGLTTIVVSDPGLAVSKTYSTNQYGMMGTSTNGHTFIVVDEEGDIAWRADYGGAPDYTMYLPVSNVLADMRAGLAAT